ncbi:MAG: hypothetical protein ACI9W2_004910 [Gammaproteobacteria bacterium]|jgi:hypothetical protein
MRAADSDMPVRRHEYAAALQCNPCVSRTADVQHRTTKGGGADPSPGLNPRAGQDEQPRCCHNGWPASK